MSLEIEVILKLIVAVFLGGVIGFEREKIHRPAGLKTNILVCLGSTLLTIISLLYFDQPHIIAAIISGMGFLGAGTILSTENKVRGLTTAAGLWMVAGIGVAIGAGFYFGAILTVLLSFLVLEYGRNLEQKIQNNGKNKRTH